MDLSSPRIPEDVNQYVVEICGDSQKIQKWVHKSLPQSPDWLV